jgi:hypothetical protein
VKRCIYYCLLCEETGTPSRPYYTLSAVWRHSHKYHARPRITQKTGEKP